MAYQKVGDITASSYVIEPNAQITYSDDGTVTVRETWVMNESDIGTIPPAPQSAHPTYTAAKCTNTAITLIGNGLAKASCEWKSVIQSFGGISIGGGGGTFTLSSVGFDNDIGAHPDRATLKTTADTAAGGTGLGWLVDANGAFIGISDTAGALAGIRSYKSGTLSWTRRWSASTSLSSTYLDKLWRVMTPDGSPPSLTAPRNWILDSVSSELNGTGYTHSATWLASEVGRAWNPDIYGT